MGVYGYRAPTLFAPSRSCNVQIRTCDLQKSNTTCVIFDNRTTSALRLSIYIINQVRLIQKTSDRCRSIQSALRKRKQYFHISTDPLRLARRPTIRLTNRISIKSFRRDWPICPVTSQWFPGKLDTSPRTFLQLVGGNKCGFLWRTLAEGSGISGVLPRGLKNDCGRR